jgi:hypothetical protein
MTLKHAGLKERLLKKGHDRTPRSDDPTRFFINPDGPEALARIEELEGALRGLIRMNEEHNAAVETVVGRPVGWTDDYLNVARRALANMEGE